MARKETNLRESLRTRRPMLIGIICSTFFSFGKTSWTFFLVAFAATMAFIAALELLLASKRLQRARRRLWKRVAKLDRWTRRRLLRASLVVFAACVAAAVAIPLCIPRGSPAQAIAAAIILPVWFASIFFADLLDLALKHGESRTLRWPDKMYPNR